MNKAAKTISPVPEGAEALLLSQMSDADIIYVASNDREMERTRQCLEFFSPKKAILEFPAWDCLPYDRASPNPQIVSKRVSTLSKLANYKKSDVSRETFIILTTVNAITQRVSPQEMFLNNSLYIEKGSKADRNQIISFLAKNGYDRVSKVMEPGEFAVRGSIIDIFPSGSEAGIRIDFFDDNVEHIKEFDALSQASSAHLREFHLLPASEIIIDDSSIELFKKNYRFTFGAAKKDDLLYERISSGIKHQGMENWLPLFFDNLESLHDYVSRETKIIYGRINEHLINDRFELIEDYYSARTESDSDYKPLSPEKLYIRDLNPHSFDSINFSAFKGEGEIDSGFRASPKIGKDFNKLNNIQKKVYIAAFSNGSATHIKNLFEHNDFKTKELDKWGSKNVSRETNDIGILIAPIEQGFETKDYKIISEQDIFGDRFIRANKKKKKPENFFEEAASLSMGELVVHEERGIGKFAGLETLEVNNIRHDMVRLLYAGDDRLYVPVENIDLISHYGANDDDAKLDKLGGTNWQERKARLKERIKLAADELLRIAAERELKRGDVINIEEGLYNEFCSRFPYSETEDQLSAVADIFEDFNKGKPMDRLVCGDVGFGKTEVAMRAAFAAAASGGQVALICPTTLLSRQHFKSFSERFDGLPFEICQTSRMVSTTNIKKNKALLESGQMDIVIGTHALLADDVKFKNLKLVIIDEEQHFGVAQKEKLKKLKAEVHLLSLSATPIPRSLQLAISGVRDLSIIATPPVDRLAIRSFISPFDELTIKEAILRERNRGGQVFYVSPRLSDLADIYKTLTKILPDIKIAQAHGQMKPTELDDVMNQFYDGKFDVLLSTAIVESGLDIQSANTMIIHRADMFGLSQLYQLRGRVGRGKTRGYAYFTLPKDKNLTDNAYKRLEVIQSLDGLGAGFSIASHDMDIRGFGNLLGEEQSGQVKEVGVELYQKMLREAVMRARAEGEVKDEEQGFTPTINIGMSVLIPENYVADLDLRMGLYKRAASLKSEDEIDNFYVELIDRFGKPPKEVTFLLEVIKLKSICKRIGISKIDVGSKAVIMQFTELPNILPNKIMEFVQSNSNRVKIRPDNKLAFTLSGENHDEILQIIESDLAELEKLIEHNLEKAA